MLYYLTREAENVWEEFQKSAVNLYLVAVRTGPVRRPSSETQGR